jgi:hypothetical protein
MVEISLSGSGEGPGWVTAPGYSTAAFRLHVRVCWFCQVPRGGANFKVCDRLRGGGTGGLGSAWALRACAEQEGRRAESWGPGWCSAVGVRAPGARLRVGRTRGYGPSWMGGLIEVPVVFGPPQVWGVVSRRGLERWRPGGELQTFEDFAGDTGRHAGRQSGLLARQATSDPLPEPLSMFAPAGRGPAG